MTVFVDDIVEARGSQPKKAQKSSQKVLKNKAWPILMTSDDPGRGRAFSRQAVAANPQQSWRGACH